MNEELTPVETVLTHYPKITEREIIIEVASWFNANGTEEFDKAVSSGLIKQNKDHSDLWELSNISKASTVVALTSSQQTMEEDGDWITVRGTHIFIPKGRNPKEVIVEKLEQLNPDMEKIPKPDSKTKEKFDYKEHKNEMKSIEKDLRITQTSIDKEAEDFLDPHTSLFTAGENFGDPVIPLRGARSKDGGKALKDLLNKGDFINADKMFAEGIKKNPNFALFKRKERWIHAFNKALSKKASTAKEFHRFLEKEELDSYLKDSPTFGVSLVGIGEGSDYKCVGLEPENKYWGGSGTDRVMVSYPTDELKDSFQSVEYTQFPRHTSENVKSSIDTTKTSAYAGETEIRVKSTTKIPVGKLNIKFNERMNFETRDAYIKKYSSLGTLSFPRAREDYKDAK